MHERGNKIGSSVNICVAPGALASQLLLDNCGIKVTGQGEKLRSYCGTKGERAGQIVSPAAHFIPWQLGNCTGTKTHRGADSISGPAALFNV